MTAFSLMQHLDVVILRNAQRARLEGRKMPIQIDQGRDLAALATALIEPAARND
jgi:hypothetical protein